METFYATFGFNQSLRNCFVKIEAEDANGARRQMNDAYGDMWAWLYPANMYGQCIARYDLKPVELGTPNVRESDE